jgi:hypothetical protein
MRVPIKVPSESPERSTGHVYCITAWLTSPSSGQATTESSLSL